jgi:hypothetical protein
MKFTKFTILFVLLSFLAVNTLDSQVKTKSKNWKSPTFTIDIGNMRYHSGIQRCHYRRVLYFKNYGKIGWGGI